MRSASWFGPFNLVRSLGAGALGEVFFARTPWKTTRCAAVKRFYADLSTSAAFAERFRQSMRIAKTIDHANIVPLLDTGAIDGAIYTCSQLVPGRDLAAISDRLADRGVGAPAAVGIRVLLDVLSALVRIEGLLEHGALGARNINVGWDGTARITDLGVPRAREAGDLQALGFALHRLYCGQTTNLALSDLRPDLPDWVSSLVGHLVLGTGAPASELFSAVVKRSVEQGLMIPHSGVASWLGELFEKERSRELAEVASTLVTAWDSRSRISQPQQASGGVAWV